MSEQLVELIEELERAQADEDVEAVQRTFLALADPLMLRGAVVPGTAFRHDGKSYWLVLRGDTLGLSICDDGYTPQVTPVAWYSQAISRSMN